MAPGAFFVLAGLTAIQNRLKLPSATNKNKMVIVIMIVFIVVAVMKRHFVILKEEKINDGNDFILISVALVNNVVLSQFLGLCPFLGVSKKLKQQQEWVVLSSL